MRRLTTLQIVLSVLTFLPIGKAHALDIPMKRQLAGERLDSKTCFAEVTHSGKLVGFELQQLMISEHGKLVALDPVGPFYIGDQTARKYRGNGLEITIVPLSTREEGNDMESNIYETAKFITKQHGKLTKLNVDVAFRCSP